MELLLQQDVARVASRCEALHALPLCRDKAGHALGELLLQLRGLGGLDRTRRAGVVVEAAETLVDAALELLLAAGLCLCLLPEKTSDGLLGILAGLDAVGLSDANGLELLEQVSHLLATPALLLLLGQLLGALGRCLLFEPSPAGLDLLLLLGEGETSLHANRGKRAIGGGEKTVGGAGPAQRRGPGRAERASKANIQTRLWGGGHGKLPAAPQTRLGP